MSTDWVVVDVEIQKTIEETPGGWGATDKLGVAVACVWEFQTERMRIYGPEDVTDLKARLLKADRISGYNIWNFDFPVIWGVPKQDWLKNSANVAYKAALATKTDDLLRRIWQSLMLNPDELSKAHGGWKLDDVAACTLGVNKIGFGGDAPKWYQAGLVQKVANYCADDVAIERDITLFVDRFGFVLNRGRPYHIPAWTGAA